MIRNISWRNILILFIAQICGTAAVIIVTFTGGMIGMQLAPSPALSTAPVAILVVGATFAAIPSAMLMKKIGRRNGSVLAALSACIAALFAAFGVLHGNFSIFCIACFFIGINSAFVQQYRFAVIENIESSLTTKAISILLFGNIISAILATQLVKISQHWFKVTYVGSFFMLAILLFISIMVLIYYKEVCHQNFSTKNSINQASLPVIFPNLVPAIIIAAGAYFVMSLIMVATPIAMHMQNHCSLSDTGLVMECHLIAMYLPSLFVGFLTKKYGNLPVVIIGMACFFIALLINYHGVLYSEYFIALILLGIGWNFTFIVATTIFTQSYLPQHRFKAQAINDLFVFGLNALASLSAGSLVTLVGWQILNFMALLPLSVMLIAVVIIGLNYKKNMAYQALISN